MWRPIFLSIGISLAIVGGECLVVEEAVIDLPRPRNASALGAAQDALSSKRVFAPPEWAPWSLISAGVIVSIYSMTLARE